MTEREILILLNFLKTGLSTRKLDKLLGYTARRGWEAWNILKKYKLINSDKGKLYLYSDQQSRSIIKRLEKSPQKGLIDKLIKQNPPTKLEKYKGTFVLADSEESFYQIFSGETRNIIRDFFSPKKKIIGTCQYKGCKSRKLDTVHFQKSRPEIFLESAAKSKKRFDGTLFKYDSYKTMRLFLQSHSKQKSVCFLCKKHHQALHLAEKGTKKELQSFKKGVNFEV